MLPKVNQRMMETINEQFARGGTTYMKTVVDEMSESQPELYQEMVGLANDLADGSEDSVKLVINSMTMVILAWKALETAHEIHELEEISG